MGQPVSAWRAGGLCKISDVNHGPILCRKIELQKLEDRGNLNVGNFLEQSRRYIMLSLIRAGEFARVYKV